MARSLSILNRSGLVIYCLTCWVKKANTYSSDSEIVFFFLFQINLLTPTNSNGRFVIQQSYLTKMNKIKYIIFQAF